MKSFGFGDCMELLQSLLPTLKYQLTVPTFLMTGVGTMVARVFGLDMLAFAALLLAWVAELWSGIQASKVRGEPFESKKFSRFSFKTVYYLVLMAVPFLFSESFRYQEKHAAAAIFDSIYVFLVLVIVLEVLVSILENVGTITGKPKTYWIERLKSFGKPKGE